MGSPKTLQKENIDRSSAAAEDFLRSVVDTVPTLVVSALPNGSVDFINKDGATTRAFRWRSSRAGAGTQPFIWRTLQSSRRIGKCPGS